MDEEVEVKIRLSEPVSRFRERLKRLGATPVKERHFEDNAVFDTPDGGLHSAGQLLRVRTSGCGGGLLTLKGAPQASARHKIRTEIETPVAHPAALMNILSRIGFSICFRYQKYRESFRLGPCTIEIDETPIGTYVEIEGRPAHIDEQASNLGFSEDDYILLSYAELFDQECAEGGGDPSEGMVFAPGPEASG